MLTGPGVTETGVEKVLPRSDECETSTRSAVPRASHKVPSGAKAGVAVNASGALPFMPCMCSWPSCAVAMAAPVKRARTDNNRVRIRTSRAGRPGQ